MLPDLNPYVKGSGTVNTVAKFTASGSIGDSNITDTGSAVTVGVKTGIGVTPSYGLHVAPTTGITAAQTAFIQDATPVTGRTNVLIQGGDNQSSAYIMEVRDKYGTLQAGVEGGGQFDVYNGAWGILGVHVISGFGYTPDNVPPSVDGVALRAASSVQWTSTLDAYDTKDLGISRNAAGVLEVNNGTAGTLRNLVVQDEAYDPTTWDGSFQVPTKNAIRDKLEAGVTPSLGRIFALMGA